MRLTGKSMFLPALGVFFAVLTCGAWGQVPEEKIDRIFAKWARGSSPGCAVGVIRDGELVFAKGYGMADISAKKAIDEDTVFEIATLSRYFTGAAAAWLVDNGAIHLDDDIRVCVPEMPPLERAITMDDLIFHTSGLSDYVAVWRKNGSGGAENAVDIVDLLTEARLEFVPGRRGRLSGSNYFMLGVLSQRVVSSSLAEWADGVIFGPAGMKNTVFCDHPERSAAGAVGYVSRGFGGYRAAVNPLPKVAGDVGLYTNIVDLARWEKTLVERRPNTEGFYEMLDRSSKTRFGRGNEYSWGLDVGKYRGMRVLSHHGSGNGFSAGMMRFPERKLTVICLANLESINTEPLVKRVAELYLGGD